jgi:hypothetical protein
MKHEELVTAATTLAARHVGDYRRRAADWTAQLSGGIPSTRRSRFDGNVFQPGSRSMTVP